MRYVLSVLLILLGLREVVKHYTYYYITVQNESTDFLADYPDAYTLHHRLDHTAVPINEARFRWLRAAGVQIDWIHR